MKFMSLFYVLLICLARSIVNAFNIPVQHDLKGLGRVVTNYRDILSDGLKLKDTPMNKEPFTNPAFCHNLDCPAYKVINKTETYELREYQMSRWVTTDKMNMKYDSAVGVMFMRLFDYIEGQNAKGEKIAMTAPVITRVIPGPGPACESNFTMSFFMAPKVKDPPAPTDKTVYLSSLPKQRVFVRYFGGRAYEKDWIDQGQEFAEKLHKDGRKFDTSFFYTAGYDSPFRLLFRHNEVWFMAKE